MTTTHNHSGYQARLDFVHDLLREHISPEADAEISPIQYEPDFIFRYNNFVYRVTLRQPFTSNHAQQQVVHQPGCVAVPNGTKELIVRLANPDAEGMHRETRIENEVAIISLAAAALKEFQPHIVPSIYAWGSAASPSSSYGWIIQELLPGTPLDEVFPSMDLQQKKQILAQMANIIKAFQDYQLPETITSFGGVTLDNHGQIVSAAMPTVGEGPWPSYEASFKSRIQIAFQKADSNPHVQGWRENGIRDRLDAFVAHGLPAQFASLETRDCKAIIHADFNPSNILLDPLTHKITALIDYDFSTISHPTYEFLRSFTGAGGQFRGWCGEEGAEQAALSDARLHGFPSPLPSSTTDSDVDWELAKALDEALENANVKMPKTLKGIERVADVDTVLRTILPWRLSNADILERQSEEVLRRCRRENEEQLGKLLGYLGF